jgi:hypothetical protein
MTGPEEHPLAGFFRRLAHGQFPPFDGLVEVYPRPPGAVGALLGFSGHHVVAADVDPEWVECLCPPGALTAPLSPSFQSALAIRLGHEPGPLDLLFVAPGLPGEPELPFRTLDCSHPHSRVRRGFRVRSEVRAFEIEGGLGVLTMGRGVARRWEAGFEVDRAYWGRGLGRSLVVAARHLTPEGEALYMQVAAANIASVRAVLAGGLAPVGVEVLFGAEAP